MKLFWALLVLASVTACGSMPSVKKVDKSTAQKAANSTTVISTINSEAPDPSPLSVERLPSGKCGMMLWTLNQDQPIFIFQAIVGEGAQMVLDGQLTNLTLVNQAGDMRHNVATKQDYHANDPAVDISLESEFGLRFEGGSYVEHGILSLSNEQGWERVTPVAGLAGCRK
ncbi:MAG: hypothetical protein ACWA5L_05935 [bacterium]